MWLVVPGEAGGHGEPPETPSGRQGSPDEQHYQQVCVCARACVCVCVCVCFRGCEDVCDVDLLVTCWCNVVRHVTSSVCVTAG